MQELNVNNNRFLWPEEEKLFKHIMVINESTIAFEDTERGTFKETYFFHISFLLFPIFLGNTAIFLYPQALETKLWRYSN